MSIVYLCGDMGNTDEWRSRYNDCETVLRSLGFSVMSISSMPEIKNKAKRERIEQAMIIASDTVCMISGWEKSEEAVRQYAYANKNGKTFFRYSPQVIFRPKEVFPSIGAKKNDICN